MAKEVHTSQKSEDKKKRKLPVKQVLPQIILAIGFIATIAYLSLTKYPKFLNIRMPRLPTLSERLIFTFRCQTFSLLALLLSVLAVALSRFSPENPNPLVFTRPITVLYQQILQNTVEQFLLSTTSQAILSTLLFEEEMKVIPLLAFYFVFGRIMFFIGYSISPLLRPFGFIVTFAANHLAIGGCVYLLFIRGIGSHLGEELYKDFVSPLYVQSVLQSDRPLS